MNKKKEQELVCLTEQCLKRYWEKDCEVMLSYCTDDILWTGAEQKEYIMGIEAVRKNFTELMNVIQPCIISNGEFIVVQNTGNACTVSGRYLVETLPEADYFFRQNKDVLLYGKELTMSLEYGICMFPIP